MLADWRGKPGERWYSRKILRPGVGVVILPLWPVTYRTSVLVP
jgi:hypothetical protein